MSSTHTTNNAKPTLHGVKIKQRKGAQKAQAKYEPEIFRDNIIKTLQIGQPGDLDAISQNLDSAGNTLEYRKYGESIFEILITGGILEPGGNIDDDGERSPFSIFSAPNEDIETIKKHVGVFSKLIRKYRYLQKAFEETLKNTMEYVNKWSKNENTRLAMATGFLVVQQLAPMTTLNILFKDHLVKEGHSLDFVTTVFKTYLTEQPIEHLGKALAIAGIDVKLIEFFPPSRRNKEFFARYFESADMKPLVDYHQRLQLSGVKNKFKHGLRELMDPEDNHTVQELTAYVKQQTKENNLLDVEVVQLIWDTMMSFVDLTTRPDQVEFQALKQLNLYSPVLATFTTSAKIEIALLQRIQIFCYEDAKLTKHFRQMVQILYKKDVLSDTAILYWNDKAVKPQGKSTFLKQLEPFVKFLREQEDESSEEEEEEEEE